MIFSLMLNLYFFKVLSNSDGFPNPQKNKNFFLRLKDLKFFGVYFASNTLISLFNFFKYFENSLLLFSPFKKTAS